MCYNTREITNQYTGQTIRVKCGHCPACLMEHAIANCNKIKNTYQDGYTCWLVTLTYRNDSCPYITLDDLNAYEPDYFSTDYDVNEFEVPVYRDCDCRRVRANANYSIYSRRTLGTNFIGSTFVPCKTLHPFQVYSWLRNQEDNKIGVLYYPDVQNFLKRLRINLKRKYGLSDNIKVFYIGEYGETYLRPHFHILIFVPYSYNPFLKRAVAASWPYADYYQSTRFCEIAKSAASYVASYVNGNVYLPEFIALSSSHSPKSRHSIHFGFGLETFGFRQVSEKIRNRTIEYTVLSRTASGQVDLRSVPLPRYVLNRFFPKIKGYSRLTSDEIVDVYTNPTHLIKYIYKLDYNVTSTFSSAVLQRIAAGHSCDVVCDYCTNKHCTQNDVIINIGKIARARRYALNHGCSAVDYAILVRDCWHLYSCVLLKKQYQDLDFLSPLEQLQRYDNLTVLTEDYLLRNGHHYQTQDEDLLDDFSCLPNHIKPLVNETLYSLLCSLSHSEIAQFTTNPNYYKDNIKRTDKLILQHRSAYKKSKTNNYLYNQVNVDI